MTTETPRTAAEAVDAARRVVVKVGSSLLLGEGETVRREWIASLAADVVELVSAGRRAVIVTSGAVGLGRRILGLTPPLRLDQKQAASAVGQADLVNAWGRAFADAGLPVAQLLLTQDDTIDRRRYLNARATLESLFEVGALPIVNENDSIATREIRYGDNDRLAAHVAELSMADALLILSDVDGLFDADPRIAAGAKLIPRVPSVTEQIEALAGGASKPEGDGAGGMATKVAAAKIAGASGCATVIAPGAGLRPLSRLAAGGPATLFDPVTTHESARRTWIRNVQTVSGALTVDAGAWAALNAGRSLLAAGVIAVEGRFRRGDVVSVRQAGHESGDGARGLSAYDAAEIVRIMGKSSEEAAIALGHRRRPAVIERRDLVMPDERSPADAAD